MDNCLCLSTLPLYDLWGFIILLMSNSIIYIYLWINHLFIHNFFVRFVGILDIHLYFETAEPFKT